MNTNDKQRLSLIFKFVETFFKIKQSNLILT